jgi:outer membrane protein assembly factor BamE (lipoprotein component of BamABCDE complex)
MNLGCESNNKSGWGAAIVAVAALALSGCAGTNFVRPEPSSFVLGQTTQQEISQKMGKPYRTGTVEKNGKTLQSASYAYANVGGEALYSGITAARSQGFYFLNSTLVGTEFSSSFKTDATDFDETKVAQIEKGKSTKANVIQLFGPPGGDFMAPLTANAADRALVYLYSQTRGSAFNLRFYTKSLVVAYNETGVVTDVQYTAQGTKD